MVIIMDSFGLGVCKKQCKGEYIMPKHVTIAFYMVPPFYILYYILSLPVVF